MTERRYTLTITEAQARVIGDACELLARLGLGQWPEFLRHMPGQIPMEYHNAIDRLLPEMAHLLSEHGPQGTAINGWNSNLGIGNRHVPEVAHIAFDLRAVIRHLLLQRHTRARTHQQKAHGKRQAAPALLVAHRHPGSIRAQDAPPRRHSRQPTRPRPARPLAQSPIGQAGMGKSLPRGQCHPGQRVQRLPSGDRCR